MIDIRIRINGTEKTYQEADTGWIIQQINRRRADGQLVCVEVIVHAPAIDMILSTPTCTGTGGSRLPNSTEKRIFDLWDRYHLSRPNFTSDDVINFLKQLAGHL